MLKLLGALLLTGGGLWAGLWATGEMGRRLSALEAWSAALGLLGAELTFRLPTLPILLRDLSHRSQPPAAQVFARAEQGMERLGELSFAEIWTQALTQLPGDLTGEDLQLLTRLGPILGHSAAQDQKTALQTAQAQLDRRAAEVREDLRQKGKAYATLGLASGALLTILLL